MMVVIDNWMNMKGLIILGDFWNNEVGLVLIYDKNEIMKLWFY